MLALPIPTSNRDGLTQQLNAFFAPALPLVAAALRGNAQAQECLGNLVSEWQNFVGCRLAEALRLAKRLTQGRTPDQIVSAYAEFWRRAGEDYGKEFTTMTKLMAEVMNKMTLAVQSAADEASTTQFLSRKTAKEMVRPAVARGL